MFAADFHPGGGCAFGVEPRAAPPTQAARVVFEAADRHQRPKGAPSLPVRGLGCNGLPGDTNPEAVPRLIGGYDPTGPPSRLSG